MKNFNTIEEYNEAFRKQFKYNLEVEIKHCQNWLNGERSYFKVGWLENYKDEKVVKDKLTYAQNLLNNIDYYVQRNSYNYKKPKSQKDNDLSFIGEGTGWAHCSVIRVPKLKRKTAWKRFYICGDAFGNGTGLYRFFKLIHIRECFFREQGSGC